MCLGDHWLCVKVLTSVSGSSLALYYDYGLFITDLHILLVIRVRKCVLYTVELMNLW